MNSGKIQDIYELTPLQHGMLFHGLYTPGADVYNIQLDFTLQGDLDELAFHRAWQGVVDRHPALRTCFAWGNLEQPYQVVHESVELKISRHDWRSRSADQQGTALAALAREDKLQSFSLDVPSLMRLNLVRLSEQEYRFFWTFHHIIVEGWSAAIVLREVGRLYDGYSRQEEVQLDRALPYSDYIRWLQQLDHSPAEAYWRRTLKGFAEPNRLPIDSARERAPPKVAHCAAVQWRLSPETTQALERFARNNRLTLSTIVQGAWALLLCRYTRSDDIVFGVVVSGRSANLRGVESMVGLCVNTLPARVHVDANERIAPWLQTIQREQAELRTYEHSPIIQAQEFSDVPHGQPLFETLVSFQNWAGELPGDAWLRNVKVRNLHIEEGSDYPLTLEAAPGPQILLVLRYDSQRFQEDAVIRMRGHLSTLLEAFVANPDQRLSDLQLLTEPERRQLVEEWNRTAAAYPAARCVHELVEEQARARPDALALECEGRRLTYRELDDRAEQVAQQLRERGVRANGLVAVYLERSLEMVVALLAVWKAGGAYVPIDPQYPPERVRFMLEDAQAAVVLSQEALAVSLGDSAAILCLDTEESVPAVSRGSRPERAPMSPQQLAYVIYTSGSTGQPKGVSITHASLCNLVFWHREAYQVTPADRATQIAGPAFDASVWELWPYLTAGASVHVPDDETRLDPGRLVRWLVEQRITLAFLPTPLAEAAMRERWPEEGALRVLLTGGDRLNQRPADKLPFRLVNHYGPTENTVVSTCVEVQSGSASTAVPPIGRPLPNTRAYVVDAHLQPVPIGVPGELLVGGAQLAAGYWRRPELTAEKFIADPFGTTPGARLYRTGDLVRHLPDGNLEFLGRIDDQVKIRGYRIELGEVEAALGRHPAVRQAVAMAREDEPGDGRLVAYVVADEGAAADLVEQLRVQLRARLPEYMIPAATVLLDELPLTPNGKVDRRALPAPDRAAYASGGYEAPVGEVETALARIWADELKLERVGRHDQFFELGGHSLLATKVVSKASEEFGLHIPLNALFEESTLSGFAEYIAMLGWSRQAGAKGESAGETERIRI